MDFADRLAVVPAALLVCSPRMALHHPLSVLYEYRSASAILIAPREARKRAMPAWSTRYGTLHPPFPAFLQQFAHETRRNNLATRALLQANHTRGDAEMRRQSLFCGSR